jgi:hypothetical protein
MMTGCKHLSVVVSRRMLSQKTVIFRMGEIIPKTEVFGTTDAASLQETPARREVGYNP